MFDIVTVNTIQRHIISLNRKLKGLKCERPISGKCHESYKWMFGRNRDRSPEHVNFTNVWSFPPHNQSKFTGDIEKGHPTAKPLPVMERLIEMLTPENGLVLDPYAGSGTTAAAAKKLNQHYIGIELNEQYCQIAERRLAKLDNIEVQQDMFDAVVGE